MVKPKATTPAAPAAPSTGEPIPAPTGAISAPPEATPAPEQGATGTGTEQPPARTFTQADLDRIVAERVARAEKSAAARLLETAGVASAEELTEKVQAARAAELAKLSDAERAQSELDQLRTQLAKTQAAAQAAKSEAQAMMVETAIAVAAAGRFANPRAVVKLVDASLVKIEAGKVIGVDAALEKLATEEPWTLAARSGAVAPPPQLGATNGATEPGKASEDEMRATFFPGTGGAGASIFAPKKGGVKST